MKKNVEEHLWIIKRKNRSPLKKSVIDIFGDFGYCDSYFKYGNAVVADTEENRKYRTVNFLTMLDENKVDEVNFAVGADCHI